MLLWKQGRLQLYNISHISNVFLGCDQVRTGGKKVEATIISSTSFEDFVFSPDRLICTFSTNPKSPEEMKVSQDE